MFVFDDEDMNRRFEQEYREALKVVFSKMSDRTLDLWLELTRDLPTTDENRLAKAVAADERSSRGYFFSTPLTHVKDGCVDGMSV